jgi:hypothetical protein
MMIGLVSTAAAQKGPIDRGSFNIGGSFSLSFGSGGLYGNDTISNISLIPSFRYFVFNGLAVGVDLLLQRNSNGDSWDTTFGIGPAVAYFFRVGSDKIYPYVGTGFTYGSNSKSWSTYSTTGFRIRFGGGAAIMLKPNVALIAEAMYAIESMSYGNDPSESGGFFTFSVGVAVFLY